MKIIDQVSMASGSHRLIRDRVSDDTAAWLNLASGLDLDELRDVELLLRAGTNIVRLIIDENGVAQVNLVEPSHIPESGSGNVVNHFRKV